MPKFIIDTDKLVECLRKVPSEERGGYIRNNIRDAHTRGLGLPRPYVLPVWLEESSEHLERLADWSKASKKGATIGGYSPAFLKFWDAYPSRNGVRSGKAQAMKVWKKIKGLTEQELLEACLKALEWQKKDEQWVKDKGMFVPMATTYLNQRRWEDEGQNNTEYEEYLDINGQVKRRLKK